MEIENQSLVRMFDQIVEAGDNIKDIVKAAGVESKLFEKFMRDRGLEKNLHALALLKEAKQKNEVTISSVSVSMGARSAVRGGVAKEDILQAIAEMSVMEVVVLVEAMEEKFGVSAAVAVAGGDAGAAVEEQTEFDVILTSFGEKKVAVIKAVRSATGLGLKEAKYLVESAPKALKEGVEKAEAEEVKKALEEAGARIAIE